MIDGYIKDEYYGECILCGATTHNKTLRLYPKGICGGCCMFPSHIPSEQHGTYVRMLIEKVRNKK